MPDRKGAVDQDVMQRTLGDISAADFLGALQDAKLSPDVMALLPDKKKYELWVEEGGISKISVGALIERIRREKKKLELEKRLIVEHIRDFGDIVDPAFREDLVREITTAVVKQIGR